MTEGKDRARPLRAALLAGAVLLAGVGCAPPIERMPPTPPSPPSTPAPAPPAPSAPSAAASLRTAERAARVRSALELQNRGDLAAALTQWRILRTLDPGDREVQRQLAATGALIRHRVQERLAAGSAAGRDGDTAGARDAYLRALALDPGNREALAHLRALEGAAVYAVQQARLDRLRDRRARAAARKAAGQPTSRRASPSGDGDGQERDYRDMGVALFKAGDYEASALELRKYLGSFPEDDETQELLREAEKRALGGERPRAPSPAPRPPPAAAAAAEDNPPGAAAAPPAEPPVATAADQAAAQDLYERGVRVYRQDIGEAIRLWEQGLERDPHHVQTRLRLEQAHKMQQRLEAIDRQ